ncbi:MAG: flavodoxin family protein [Phycisphaerae bacterium]|nr:flavodoxin family protein [Phycisphaerae bacterium]
MDRRMFLNSSLVAGASVAGIGSQGLAAEGKKITILGISCSPRKGMTTATGIKVALKAAEAFSSNIKTEFIDLGGITFSGWTGSSSTIEDDFDRQVLSKLKDASVGGLIIGSPVYFRNPSSVCMAFMERMAVLRKPKLLLANKAVGTLAVGGSRNGGQEMVIQQIQTSMLCHEVVIVGGKPSAHQGATLWNAYKDDIMKDEFGIDSARKLGLRVAEAALKLSNRE